jgi:hypothetical protein
MNSFGHGWDCGASNGEALSRILSAEIYPGSQRGFRTGASWLDGSRPDFVNSTDGSDRHFVSIGCGTLFINYLRHQLGFSLNQIIAAGASTFAQAYANITKDTSDPFPVFGGLLQVRFPAGAPSGLVDDNPWPLATDQRLSLRRFAAAQGLSASGGIRNSMGDAGVANLRGWLNSDRPDALVP